MNARELLSDWPSLDAFDAEDFLASPAWRKFVDIGDEEGVLTRGESAADELLLNVTLEDRPVVLGLADSEAFPDLHLLWSRLSELPEVIIIALIEKEASAVLEAVEGLTRTELRLIGVAEAKTDAAASVRTGFRLETEAASYGFSFAMPDDVKRLLGVRENLDPNHEAIRSLSRGARVRYAAVELADEAVGSASPGDCLLIDAGEPFWQTEFPEDGLLQICSSDESSLTFAQLADDDLPEIPAPGALTVFRHGVPFAAAEMSVVGEAPAVKILNLISNP